MKRRMHYIYINPIGGDIKRRSVPIPDEMTDSEAYDKLDPRATPEDDGYSLCNWHVVKHYDE